MEDTPSARIRDEIRHNILSGRLAPGARLPTERELAVRYSVSSTTINKVMTALELDGLLERRRGTGTYVRSDLARALAVVLGPPHAPPGAAFWADLARQVLESAAKREGGVRTYFVAGTGPLSETPLAADAKARRFAAAFLLGADAAAGILGDASIPYVHLAGHGPGPTLAVAWREATRDLVADMLRRGVLPLAIQLPPGRPGDEVAAGYREALVAAGAPADEGLIGPASAADGPAGWTWAQEMLSRRGARGLLLAGERPEAALVAAATEVDSGPHGSPRRPVTHADGAQRLALAVWCLAGRVPAYRRELARLELDPGQIVQAGFELLRETSEKRSDPFSAPVSAGPFSAVRPRFIEGATLPPRRG